MVILRRCWNCGEADWLRHERGVEDLRATLGYPLRFTARETYALYAHGVTRETAAAADPTATVADLISDAAIPGLPEVRQVDPLSGPGALPGLSPA